MSNPDKLSQLISQWQQELQRELDQNGNLPEAEKRLELLQQMEKTLTQSPEGQSTDLIKPTGTDAQPSLGDIETMASEQSLGDVDTMGSAESLGDVNTTDDTKPHASKPTSPSSTEVHGYQIVRELGRGGMGVVYEAIQPDLKRSVALKMILAGGHASESQLQRFRIEAEAVARLKHPNIVQIYEIGEQNGLPYFSLEFCEGGALNDKLDGTPWQEADAAKLMQTLATGMQAAHDAGVVHRDLKPHNVLLDANSTPKITDFGLAKRLEEGEGVTKTESVMGTPSYMAPEQAKGKTKEVGPAADVYSLGAMLYELLTGRPPFKAASAWDTIAQVINEEPVSPRQLNPKVSKDLETVCLKCLEKEPGKRYISAEALAKDLERFQAGKPIAARPVGRGEKLFKWVKRNPVVAGLLLLVMVVLLAGTGVSTWFAIQSDENAARAERKAGEALKAKEAEKRRADAEEKAKTEEQKAKADLEKTNRELIASVARSLLRPLISKVQPGQPPPLLSDVEREALSELEKSNSDELRIQFVKEAMQSPLKTRQLRFRAKEALQAAVGMSSRRRAQIDQVLLSQLQQKGLSEEQRIDMALIAAELGNPSVPLASGAIDTLSQAISRGPVVERTVSELSQGLSKVAASLQPGQAPGACAQAAAILSEVMSKTTGSIVVKDLQKGLSTLTARMAPKEGAAILIRAISRTTDYRPLQHLSLGVSTLAAQMSSKEAAHTAATLSQVLSTAGLRPAQLKSLAEGLSALAARMEPEPAVAILTQAVGSVRDSDAMGLLLNGISSAAARMEPKRAAQAAATILAQIQGTTDPLKSLQLKFLSQGLSRLAARIEIKAAAQLCSQASAALSQLMRKPISASGLLLLSEGLSSLSARMSSKSAAQSCSQAAAALIAAMSKTTDSNQLEYLSQQLASLAADMEPKAAAQICSQAAAILTGTMSRTMDPSKLRNLTNGLSSVAARMESKEAAQACAQAVAILNQARTKITNPSQLPPLLSALSKMAMRMEPKEAAAILTEALSRLDPQKSVLTEDLLQNLIAVAAQMEPNEAATFLTRAISSTTNAIQLHSLSQGLAGVAVRMTPQEAAEIHAQVAAILLEAIDKRTNPSVASPLPQSLASVMTQMAPEKAMAILSQAMSRTMNSLTLEVLSQTVLTLARHMTPKEAHQAATTLIEALSGTRNRYAPHTFSQSIAAVSDRMAPKEAARAGSLILQAMRKPANHSKLGDMAQSLASIMARMEPGEAAQTSSQAVVILSQAIMSSPSISSRLDPLSHGLSSLAARMTSKEASQTAAMLTRAMKKTKDRSKLAALSKPLASFAAKMEVKAAAQVCSQAAALLLRAIKRTRDGYQLKSLAQSLTPIAARMSPEEAAQVCSEVATLLSQVMSKTTHLATVQSLSEVLASVAVPMAPKEGAATLTQAMSKTTNSIALRHLSQGLSSVALRMAPKEGAAILIQAMSRTRDESVSVLQSLANGLSLVAARMEQREATLACSEAAAILFQAMSNTSYSAQLGFLLPGLSSIAAQMEPKAGAAILLQAISRASEARQRSQLVQGLTDLLVEIRPRDRAARSVLVARSVAELAQPSQWLTGCALPIQASEPLPSRLKPQQLVDLLKLYTCTGEAQRLVLDQLEHHYNQKFANQWDFVRYAQEAGLKLDLPGPPDFPSLPKDRRAAEALR